MSTVETTAESVATAIALTPEKILNSSMLLAAGAGAIPLPIWDAVAVAAVQLKMISDLSAHYGVPFQQNWGKTALAGLLGGMAPALAARGTIGMAVKVIPGLGSLFGLIAQPAFAAAVTYAIGKTFISHFESGGTLITFSASNFKNTFADEVKAGFKKVSEVKL